MSSGQIIMELNDLENSNSLSKRLENIHISTYVFGLDWKKDLCFRLKLWFIIFVTWLCPTIGLTFLDIFFDSLLAIEYYAQWSNESYVNKSIER